MSEGNDLFERALALPARDRAALVDVLNDSLEDAEADLSPEWKAEIARRIAAIERGESRVLSADQVEARVQATLERM